VLPRSLRRPAPTLPCTLTAPRIHAPFPGPQVQRLVCGPSTALSAKTLLPLLQSSCLSLTHVTLNGGAVEGLRAEKLEGPLLQLRRLRHLELDGVSLAPERT